MHNITRGISPSLHKENTYYPTMHLLCIFNLSNHQLCWQRKKGHSKQSPKHVDHLHFETLNTYFLYGSRSESVICNLVIGYYGLYYFDERFLPFFSSHFSLGNILRILFIA